MVGVWDYPHLDDLESFIQRGISEAMDRSIESLDEERAQVVEALSLERILVVDEWGRGTANMEEDILRPILFFDLEGVDRPDNYPEFDPASRHVTSVFITIINSGGVEMPPEAGEWFAGFEPSPAAITRYEDTVARNLGSAEGNTVFDLTIKQAIVFSEGVSVDNLPRIPLVALRGEDEEEEPEEVIEEPDEIEEPEPIEVEPDYPNINPNLRQFAVSEDELEIPAGKETKEVEPREPYKFELMMALPLDEIRERGLQGRDTGEPTRQLTNGVGFQVQIGMLGINEPPATFPRTSSYIKNRLLHEGPAYILELYRDLVVYSGLISGYYNMTFRPGSYTSFRQFIYRLKEIGRRGGPELIEGVSQQRAASMGLETVPDHPTIEGEKAPWLENRKYIDIVEDNKGHSAWNNPVEYLQETLSEE